MIDIPDAEKAERFRAHLADMADRERAVRAAEREAGMMNALSGRIISDIVRSIAEAGGDGEDVAILLADIAAKVLRIALEPGIKPDIVIEDFVGKLHERMAQLGPLT